MFWQRGILSIEHVPESLVVEKIVIICKIRRIPLILLILSDGSIVSISQSVEIIHVRLKLVVNLVPSVPILEQNAGVHLLVGVRVSVEHTRILVVVLYGAHTAWSYFRHVLELVFCGACPTDVKLLPTRIG